LAWRTILNTSGWSYKVKPVVDRNSFNKIFHIRKGEMIMKKTNKGFSMVELIIVIAIMAILAGALAPALIKYINKSRLSTDVQTAQTIATAVQTAFSNEDAFNAAKQVGSVTVPVAVTISPCSTADFDDEFAEALNMSSAPKAKSKKDLNGSGMTNPGTFYFTFAADGKSLSVWVGGSSDAWLAYPSVGNGLSK
jgi:type IV pilus assembly protein PilA